MSTSLGQDREPGSVLPLAEQFRFDAGSPALNLLATLGRRGADQPVERLTSPDRFAEWLAANGLPEVAVDDRAAGAARTLREAAYPTLSGGSPSAGDVATMSRWAAVPAPARRLALGPGGVVWDDEGATIRSVLGELARDLAALAVAAPPELRTCATDTCLMLYLDRSRGHRRTWCSMGRCGNAAKVARHRGRSVGAR